MRGDRERLFASDGKVMRGRCWYGPDAASVPREASPGEWSLTASTPIEVRTFDGRGRDEVAALWRDLESVSDCGLAASWDWTETWLNVYGDVVPHRYAVCTRDGAPCAIALLTRSIRRKPGIPAIRVLHLGTAGEPSGGVYVEWNRLLSIPTARSDASAALLHALEEDRSWDELALDGFDPAHAKPFLGASRTIVWSRPSPFTDLNGLSSDSDLLDRLGSGPRRRLRQSLKAFGDLHCEWATGTEHALDILDELARLHAQGWARRGQAGAFSEQQFAVFHRELVKRLMPAGRTILFRVRSSSGTVGCLYSLLDGKRVLFYQSGFGQFQDNRLRPGMVSHLLCMRACADRGLEEYDFLVGEARYKDELSTGSRDQIWAEVRRPRLRFAALAGLRAGRRLLMRPAPAVAQRPSDGG